MLPVRRDGGEDLPFPPGSAIISVYKRTAAKFAEFCRSRADFLEREAATRMMIQYTPRGVCSRGFQIQVEEGVIQSVRVEGGCDGNLKGLSSLLRGRRSAAWRASAAAPSPPPAPTSLPRR